MYSSMDPYYYGCDEPSDTAVLESQRDGFGYYTPEHLATYDDYYYAMDGTVPATFPTMPMETVSIHDLGILQGYAPAHCSGTVNVLPNETWRTFQPQMQAQNSCVTVQPTWNESYSGKTEAKARRRLATAAAQLSTAKAQLAKVELVTKKLLTASPKPTRVRKSVAPDLDKAKRTKKKTKAKTRMSSKCCKTPAHPIAFATAMTINPLATASPNRMPVRKIATSQKQFLRGSNLPQLKSKSKKKREKKTSAQISAEYFDTQAKLMKAKTKAMATSSRKRSLKRIAGGRHVAVSKSLTIAAKGSISDLLISRKLSLSDSISKKKKGKAKKTSAHTLSAKPTTATDRDMAATKARIIAPKESRSDLGISHWRTRPHSIGTVTVSPNQKWRNFQLQMEAQSSCVTVVPTWNEPYSDIVQAEAQLANVKALANQLLGASHTKSKTTRKVAEKKKEKRKEALENMVLKLPAHPFAASVLISKSLATATPKQVRVRSVTPLSSLRVASEPRLSRPPPVASTQTASTLDKKSRNDPKCDRRVDFTIHPQTTASPARVQILSITPLPSSRGSSEHSLSEKQRVTSVPPLCAPTKDRRLAKPICFCADCCKMTWKDKVKSGGTRKKADVMIGCAIRSVQPPKRTTMNFRILPVIGSRKVRQTSVTTKAKAEVSTWTDRRRRATNRAMGGRSKHNGKMHSTKTLKISKVALAKARKRGETYTRYTRDYYAETGTGDGTRFVPKSTKNKRRYKGCCEQLLYNPQEIETKAAKVEIRVLRKAAAQRDEARERHSARMKAIAETKVKAEKRAKAKAEILAKRKAERLAKAKRLMKATAAPFKKRRRKRKKRTFEPRLLIGKYLVVDCQRHRHRAAAMANRKKKNEGKRLSATEKVLLKKQSECEDLCSALWMATRMDLVRNMQTVARIALSDDSLFCGN